MQMSLPSSPAAGLASHACSDVDQLLAEIPMTIQTPLYLSLLAPQMWMLTREHSQASNRPQHQLTAHGSYDLHVKHDPRQYHHPVPRMFSPVLARAHNIVGGEVDTSVYVIVLPPTKEAKTRSSTAEAKSVGTATPPSSGIVVHCTIPLQQLRSSSDPLHPFAHTSLQRSPISPAASIPHSLVAGRTPTQSLTTSFS
jgi:hypothetical protein